MDKNFTLRGIIDDDISMSKVDCIRDPTGEFIEPPEEKPELSVVFPCLNERETVATCVRKALRAFRENGISGEVIVADNGSTDGSQEIASAGGARVIHVSEQGYGSAVRGGIREARADYVLMVDCDDSYDISHLPRFVEGLRAGADVVMGNRFRGGIADDAMPFLHRYLGNPVLSWLGKLFFHAGCGDFHCGMRAFRKETAERMNLRSTGMEFASEMVVKASLLGLKVAEIPTTLSPDGRSRRSHLRTWRDGWRHLRFLLMYSPRWLFLYPGMALMTVGLAGCAWLLPKPALIGTLGFDVHTLLYAFVAIVLGLQLVGFATLTKVFAISEGLLPEDTRLNSVFRYITLEMGVAVGFVMVTLGVSGSALAVSDWGAHNFGALDPSRMLRIVLPSAFSLMLGVEIIFGSFFLSILQLKRR